MRCQQCGFDPCACGKENPDGPTPYELIDYKYGGDLADAVYMAMHLYDKPKSKFSKRKFVAAAMFALPTKDLEKIMERVKEARK